MAIQNLHYESLRNTHDTYGLSVLNWVVHLLLSIHAGIGTLKKENIYTSGLFQVLKLGNNNLWLTKTL